MVSALISGFIVTAGIHADDDADYAAEIEKNFEKERRKVSELFRGRVNLLLHLKALAPDIWNPEIATQFEKWSNGYGQQILLENAQLLTKAKRAIDNYARLRSTGERRKRLNDAQSAVDAVTINNNNVVSDMAFIAKQLPIAAKLREILEWQEINLPGEGPTKLRKLAEAERQLREAMLGDLNLLAQLLEHVSTGESEKLVFASKYNAENAVEKSRLALQKAQIAAKTALWQLLAGAPPNDEALQKTIDGLVAANITANEDIIQTTNHIVFQIKLSPELESWFIAAGLKK